jgi:hypothetical protein
MIHIYERAYPQGVGLENSANMSKHQFVCCWVCVKVPELLENGIETDGSAGFMKEIYKILGLGFLSKTPGFLPHT